MEWHPQIIKLKQDYAYIQAGNESVFTEFTINLHTLLNDDDVMLSVQAHLFVMENYEDLRNYTQLPPFIDYFIRVTEQLHAARPPDEEIDEIFSMARMFKQLVLQPTPDPSESESEPEPEPAFNPESPESQGRYFPSPDDSDNSNSPVLDENYIPTEAQAACNISVTASFFQPIKAEPMPQTDGDEILRYLQAKFNDTFPHIKWQLQVDEAQLAQTSLLCTHEQRDLVTAHFPSESFVINDKQISVDLHKIDLYFINNLCNRDLLDTWVSKNLLSSAHLSLH